MKYQVGQIVYLLSNSDMKIFPVQIIEEITRKRIGGEEVTYKIVLPNKSRTISDLESVDATPFTSPGELRSHMIENAIRMIDTMIDRANRLSTQMFENEQPVQDYEEVVE
jgi:hypothetical protein